MLETQTPVEVITTLRAAERLLLDQAEQLRRAAVTLTGYGDLTGSARYRELVETAADLGRLADLIATEAEG